MLEITDKELDNFLSIYAISDTGKEKVKELYLKLQQNENEKIVIFKKILDYTNYASGGTPPGSGTTGMITFFGSISNPFIKKPSLITPFVPEYSLQIALVTKDTKISTNFVKLKDYSEDIVLTLSDLYGLEVQKDARAIDPDEDGDTRKIIYYPARIYIGKNEINNYLIDILKEKERIGNCIYAEPQMFVWWDMFVHILNSLNIKEQEVAYLRKCAKELLAQEKSVLIHSFDI